jgi:type II secretory ATPase GspE/PulE/Tfp pilus assembly ATPase PilB-like protein
MGIYEVLEINDVIRDAIRAKKNISEMYALAKENGYLTLAEDALAKVSLGMTTLDECRKVGIL